LALFLRPAIELLSLDISREGDDMHCLSALERTAEKAKPPFGRIAAVVLLLLLASLPATAATPADAASQNVTLSANGPAAIYYTTNGSDPAQPSATIWQKSNLPDGGYITSIVIDPNDSQTIYAGGTGGVFKSVNGGTSWSSVNSGLSNTYITVLAIDPTNTQILYAGSQIGYIFKSVNGGTSWSVINTESVSGGYLILSLAIDPVNSQIIYASSSNSWLGLMKSTDGGNSWNSANAGLPIYVLSIVSDPSTPQTLYAKTPSGVYKTVNSGGSWSPINTGLTSTNIRSLAVTASTPQTLYVVTIDGVFKSVNGGGSWSAVNTALPNASVTTLAVNPSNPQTLYIGTSGGVFKSTDGGGSWSAVNTGLTDTGILTLTVDPSTPQTVYVGTPGGSSGRSMKGVTGVL
jgi:photosystem II stability/assembly factor-like uncharacterized protein